jgi:hypothetical protein
VTVDELIKWLHKNDDMWANEEQNGKLMTQCLRGMYRHDSKVLNSTEDAYTVIFESTITPGATSFALDGFSSMLGTVDTDEDEVLAHRHDLLEEMPRWS